MEVTTRFSALARRDLPFMDTWSTPGSSEGWPRRRRWTTALSTLCSGSGPNTIAPWTSQDWAGGKGSSGIWSVSGPDPESARHQARPVPVPVLHQPPGRPSPPLRSRIVMARDMPSGRGSNVTFMNCVVVFCSMWPSFSCVSHPYLVLPVPVSI